MNPERAIDELRDRVARDRSYLAGFRRELEQPTERAERANVALHTIEVPECIQPDAVSRAHDRPVLRRWKKKALDPLRCVEVRLIARKRWHWIRDQLRRVSLG